MIKTSASGVRASCVLASLVLNSLVVSMPAARADEFIEISPDDTVLVERYVRAIPEPPPIIEEHMTLRPGSVLPAAVPLRRFEGQPSLDRYGFFVSVDHKIVVVDPRSRIVVRILDQRG